MGPMPEGIVFRRIATDEAEALRVFYNGLSEPSKRTFRPLGQQTTLDACAGVVQDNQGPSAPKFDLVAVAGARIVGWGFLWGMDTPEPTLGLGVADDYHGCGIGGRLMDAVLDAARTSGKAKVHLTVVQDNERAWRLYERRGFVRQGECTGDDGLPYYRMTWEIGAR